MKLTTKKRKLMRIRNKLKKVSSGKVLINEGDYSNSINLILDGNVKVCNENKEITLL